MKRTLLLISGRVLVVVGMAVSIRLMTSLISPEQVGRMNILLSGIAFFSIILVNPVGVYLTRQINSLNLKAQVLSGVFGYLIYCGLIGLVTAIGLWFFDSIFGLGIQMFPAWLLLLAFMGLFVTSGQSLLVGLMNILNRSIAFVVLTSLTVWGGLVAAVLMVVFAGHKAEFWYSGKIIAEIIVLLVVIWYYYRKFPCRVFPSLSTIPFHQALNFSWPFMVGAIFYWMQIQGYRFLLERYGTLGDVGVFSVCFGLGIVLVSTIESVMLQIWQPQLYKGITTNNSVIRAQAWESYSTVIIPGMLLTCIFAVSLSFHLVSILTDTSYHQYGWLLAYGAITEFFRTVSSVWGMIAHSELKTSKLLPVGIFGIVPLLFFPFFSTHMGPLLGMAVTLVVSQFTSMTIMIVLMSKLLSVKFSWQRILLAMVFGLPLLAFLLPARSIHPLISIFFGGVYWVITEYSLARKYV